MPQFEEMLDHSGIKLLQYCLDIDKNEHMLCLTDRQQNSLKRRKSRPIDAVAGKHCRAQAEARNAMLLRTHTAVAPWPIVKANDKRLARLNPMRDILFRMQNACRKNKLLQPDPGIAFAAIPEWFAATRRAR